MASKIAALAVVGALSASPALALDNPASEYAAGTPGETFVPETVPPTDRGGTDTPGTLSQPDSFPGDALTHVPADVPAVGLRCLEAYWPPSGEAFRDCVRNSVTALRAAKRALRTDRTDSVRRAARMGCAKAGFSRRPEAGESRSEFGRCVSAVRKTLAAQRARRAS